MRRLPLLSWVARVDSGRRLLRAAWAIQILGLLLWTAPLQAVGQEIHGEVRAKGVGIAVAGADVRVLGADSTLKGEKYSDEHGGFVFKHLSPGPYAIRVDAPGFARQVEGHVLVRQNEVVNVMAWLDPQPITIPKLEVKARRRDYAFIRQEIGLSVQSLRPSRIVIGARLDTLAGTSSDFVTLIHKDAIPGLVVFGASKSHPGPCFQIDGTVDQYGNPVCAEVFLDDVPLDPDMLWTVDTDLMDLGAVVVLAPYQAATMFGTYGGGGVVLIYTRDVMGMGLR